MISVSNYLESQHEGKEECHVHNSKTGHLLSRDATKEQSYDDYKNPKLY